MSSTLIYHQWLGVIDYQKALAVQHKWHAHVVQNKLSGVILGLEHPAVITLGKNARKAFLHYSPGNTPEQRYFDIVETDRGGEVTGHEPGQLVIYPILNLRQLKLFPKTYVCKLEQIICRMLRQEYQLSAHIRRGFPGVWIEDRKICSIGIRIHQRVSLHGIALNVHNSLDIFRYMTPCGLNGVIMSNLLKEKNKSISVEDVWQKFLLYAAQEWGPVEKLASHKARNLLNDKKDHEMIVTT